LAVGLWLETKGNSKDKSNIKMQISKLHIKNQEVHFEFCPVREAADGLFRADSLFSHVVILHFTF
jgi:hypothetical protein